MNIITGYNDPIKIQLNYDNEGKSISKEMQPETHTIINNKITLIQIPDEFYRVIINGMTELHSYDDSPIQPNNFRVNYQNGLVTFHNNLEGQTIIVDKYWGRGIILTPATRIYSRVNEAGEVVETMQGLINSGESAIEGLQQLEAKLTETNQAIQNANSSADNANIKAQLAEDNAILAQNSANLAETKALDAQLAAENANEAVSNLYHVGEYDIETLYKPRNVVSYLGSSYMCIQESSGNLPIDENYWKLIGKKGDKGATLTPTGTYNSERQYEVGDLVVYDGVVYNCIQPNLGVTPDNEDYWELFLAGGMTQHDNEWHTEEYETVTGSQDKVDELAGNGRTDETVKGNADKILDLIADVGELDNLETTEKANMVLALNEIYQDLVEHKAETVTKEDVFTSLNWFKEDGNSDTQTFKNALNSLSVSGGKLYVPKGEYYIDETLTIPYGVTLEGSGEHTKINLIADVPCFKINGESRITLKGMSIIGYGGPNQKGVLVENSSTRLMFDTLFLKNLEIGIDIDYSWIIMATNIVIENCTIGINRGPQGNSLLLNGCVINGCSEAGVKGVQAGGLTILSCAFHQNKYGVYLSNACSATNIVGSYFENNDINHIRVVGGTSNILSRVKGLNITGNIFQELTNSSGLTGDELKTICDISLRSISGVSITNNSFNKAHISGQLVKILITEDNEDVPVEGLTIKDNHQNEPTEDFIGWTTRFYTSSLFPGRILKTIQSNKTFNPMDTIPTDKGKWYEGDIVPYKTPSTSGYIGQICTKTGEYGTAETPVFKNYGAII